MPPLLTDIIWAAVIFGLAILLARLAHYTLEFATTRLIGRTKTRLDDVLISSVDFTLSAAIVVAGEPIFERGAATGARPGKLVRAGR